MNGTNGAKAGGPGVSFSRIQTRSTLPLMLILLVTLQLATPPTAQRVLAGTKLNVAAS